MVTSLMYFILAILGLSFLIFIHELGHYFMARRVGMRVETFSIGFGRPLYSWERKGVKWQIGWLLFGGYVKIAGVDLDKDQNPYEVADGFFGKRPIDRIKVAVMGPVANLVFALVAFFFLWSIGGREKNFSEYTKKIGWVDPASELYAQGVRPGDEILAYNHDSYRGATDNLYAPMTSDDKIEVEGMHVNYGTGRKEPIDLIVKVYPHPIAMEPGFKTAGIISPANYIIYNRVAGGAENPLPEGSPLQNSGIEYGDRVVWVDGELVFSVAHLNHLLNDNRALLTVQRGGQILLFRVPRVEVKELWPDAEFKEEMIDWQFEAKLNNIKTQNLYAIPYNITNNGVVENRLRFIDKEKEAEAFAIHPFSQRESALQPGDKILAVNGTPIQHAYELLQQLQSYKVNIVVQRNDQVLAPLPSNDADKAFDQEINAEDIQQIAQGIGTTHPITHAGDYYLLNPVIPKPRSALMMTPEKQQQLASEIQHQKQAIEAMADPEQKAHALRQLEKQEKSLLLGFAIQDRKVVYNPTPTELFSSVFQEIKRTLGALFSGALNPKWLLGPVGIVQVVHDSSMNSLKEALYWLGAISLNLGILNLLPIPVLDGGTILMSFFEMVTGKRLHPKTLEKLVIPFAVLLIGFFIFLTYNDVMRLLQHLWS